MDTRTCKHDACKAVFTVKMRTTRRFCSDLCRSRYHNERYRRRHERVREALDGEIERLQALREELK